MFVITKDAHKYNKIVFLWKHCDLVGKYDYCNARQPTDFFTYYCLFPGHHFGFGGDVKANDVEVAICINHKCMKEIIGRDLSPSFDCQVLLERGNVNGKPPERSMTK